ncbi:MAG: RNA polymerase sigma factor [Eubacterium sp.]
MMIIPFLDLIDTEEDKERFIYCYTQYKNLMFKVAYERLHDSHLAEDAVQDAYFYIAKNFHKIDDEKSPESRNYIRMVTRSKANRIAEKQDKYILEEPDFDDNCEIQTIEDDAFNNYEIDKLMKAINNLNEKYKIPIMLKCIYNHRSKEIAEIMGVTDDVVRRRIYLGKQKLKKMLKSEMKTDD